MLVRRYSCRFSHVTLFLGRYALFHGVALPFSTSLPFPSLPFPLLPLCYFTISTIGLADRGRGGGAEDPPEFSDNVP